MSLHSLPPRRWPAPPPWTAAAAVVALVLLWVLGKLAARRLGWSGATLAHYLTAITVMWALALIGGYLLWIKGNK
jgi:hypothetical protein